MPRANKKYVQLTVAEVMSIQSLLCNTCWTDGREVNIRASIDEVLTLARENGNQTVCLAYAVVRDKRKGLGKPGTAGKEK